MPKRRRTIIKSSEVFQTQSKSLKYVLSRSNARRSLSIAINEVGRVQVSVPVRTPVEDVQRFIADKFDWILKAKSEMQKHQTILAAKDYVDGAMFLFLGKEFPLYVERGAVKRARIQFDHHCWRVVLPQDAVDEREIIKTKLKSWYKAQGEEVLGAKSFQFARMIGVTPKKIQIRNQKRLWGCCHWNQQSITLNWQIMLAPISVVDYVVIHELCHLTHPNHGKRFWNKVAKYMPEYKIEQKWLKDHQTDLMLPK